MLISLLGNISCFAIGTYVALSLLSKVLQSEVTLTSSTLLIGKVVSGIEYYLIGIALVILGYWIYALVVSDIDPRRQEKSELRRNLLNIDSLDSLEQTLTREIMAALIMTTFKLIVSLKGKP